MFFCLSLLGFYVHLLKVDRFFSTVKCFSDLECPSKSTWFYGTSVEESCFAVDFQCLVAISSSHSTN